ncbi:MAG TPA: DUF4157 domain-containing protein [Thermoanaerobaculia bacterium]|nr:DUF4157 domain-containing protein [Thermoanaerobaculia bacterium]
MSFLGSAVIQGRFVGGQGPRFSAPPTARPSHVQPRAAAPGSIQRHTATMHPNAVAVPAHLAHVVNAAGGSPLPPAVRQKMEAAFGMDFSDVRVHVGQEAAQLGAVAFTRGTHIHFAPGQYNPSTVHGHELIAHELAHVVQQRSGRVRNPFGNGVAVVHDATLEAEAARMSTRAAAHIPSPAVQRMALHAQMRQRPTPPRAPIQRAIPNRFPIQRAQGGSNPGEIPEMVGEILKFLPKEDVIKVRRVNSTWEAEASHELHQRGVDVQAIYNAAWWANVYKWLRYIGIGTTVLATLGVLYYTDWTAFQAKLGEIVRGYMKMKHEEAMRYAALCQENPLFC